MTHRFTALMAVALAAAALPLTACIGREIASSGDAWNGTAFSAEMVDSKHPDEPMSRIYKIGRASCRERV